jgi:hypothetical protein
MITYLLPLLLSLTAQPERRHEDDVTALWLARSCIGEAGFDAAESGECAAIWWVYRRGAASTGRTVRLQARLYSSAIKRGPHHNRPWIFDLNRSGKKPRGWRRGASWGKHRDRWLKTLALADLFLQWRIPDPLPGVEHYGGSMDRDLSLRKWRRIKIPGWRNWFYSRRSR